MSPSGINPFRVLGRQARAGADQAPAEPGISARDRLHQMVSSAEIFILMKGSPEHPLCGFSANTSAALKSLGRPFSSFDVLSDEGIRAEAKRYADWPTFPQVYLRGEFIGGHDIVTQMIASGDLQRLVEGS